LEGLVQPSFELMEWTRVGPWFVIMKCDVDYLGLRGPAFSRRSDDRFCYIILLKHYFEIHAYTNHTLLKFTAHTVLTETLCSHNVFFMFSGNYYFEQGGFQ
jgi:hypothetical protein